MMSLKVGEGVTTDMHRSADSHSVQFLQYRITPPSANFYNDVISELIPCCGYEYPHQDFHVAVSFLNSKLNLKLDPIECRAFGLLLTGLSQARRFGRDPHIEPDKGENSAVHSCHAAILVNELFRRAGLLEIDQQTPETLELRINSTLAALIHDLGEILGEFSSLADRTLNKSQVEIPEIEREVFNTTLKAAFYFASRGPEAEIGFYSFLTKIREEARINPKAVVPDPEKALDAARRYSTEFDLVRTDHRISGSIERILGLFDVCELRSDLSTASSSDRFVGYLTKLVDHIQGTRHLVRFSCKHPDDTLTRLFNPHGKPIEGFTSADSDTVIPIRYSTNQRVRGNAFYMEAGIADLYREATSTIKQQLAEIARKAIYLTMAEWLQITRPIIDRECLTEDAFMRALSQATPKDRGHGSDHSTIKRLYLETLIANDTAHYELQRESLEGQKLADDQIYRYETRERLVALYLTASEREYVPSDDTPIAFLAELPPQLRGFMEYAEGRERHAYGAHT